SHTFESACGRVIPKVNIGAIRGGIPYRPNRTSPHCAIYVDVRVIPGADLLAVQRELESVVESAEVGARVEMFLGRSGNEGQNVEPLAEQIRLSYKELAGQDAPAKAPSEVVSMWRDIIVFNTAGIPSVTFGPPRRRDEASKRLYFELSDLVTAAQIYARVAYAISNQARQKSVAGR
ncbi:MAG: peptidase dimerization domain-containing protein, partial [Terriglobia bacterium]